jgi:hypothetical protein
MAEKVIAENDMLQQKNFFSISEPTLIYQPTIQRPHLYFLQRYTHLQAIAFCQEILRQRPQLQLQDFIEHMVVLLL